jgi:cytochrome c556
MAMFRPPLILTVLVLAACAGGEPATHSGHVAALADTREVVEFPPALRTHTLANMRDHLATVQQLQDALARADYERAAALAEERLGLSSLEAHGAHDVAPYMPQGMQELGTDMHKAASRFAIEASDAGATGDAKPAIAALAQLTAQCVACHAAYRFK